jgi:hypothetical protein
VIFVEDGKAAATGRHRELLTAEPAYAATVTREDLISEGRTPISERSERIGGTARLVTPPTKEGS